MHEHKFEGLTTGLGRVASPICKFRTREVSEVLGEDPEFKKQREEAELGLGGQATEPRHVVNGDFGRDVRDVDRTAIVLRS